jgi:mono/diheme cytochrome c family protein
VPSRLYALVACLFPFAPASAQSPDDQFEKKVRPLFLAKCAGCHGPEKSKGGLRLDTADAFAKGGESGPAVVAGDPDKSRLVKAVRGEGDVQMPPGKKLAPEEVAVLVEWVERGAVWPGYKAPATKGGALTTPDPLEPDAKVLAPNLQAWYKADALHYQDAETVYLWPDSSGHGRDLAPTKGSRAGGIGSSPKYVTTGTVNQRRAVRFGEGNGLGSSPALPVKIDGDAPYTIFVVANLTQRTAGHPYDVLVGFGDVGRPAGGAALCVERTSAGADRLYLAAGVNRGDIATAAGSFKTAYTKPHVFTVTKTAGPGATTRVCLDGQSSASSIVGTETTLDIRHRDDFGVYIGAAMNGLGAIHGDVSEVLVYNKALSDVERQGVEASLGGKYDIALPSTLLAIAAKFTGEQKGFWAFQPVKSPAPPVVKDKAWPNSPLDHFVLAKLEAKGLKPSPKADKRTLIRRATFDLTGLPPTPAEIDAYFEDDSPEAFTRVVDRLLSSPHYGERWGRHWLDIARFGESDGFDGGAYDHAWKYRDYVVRAFNADKPYDEFVREQLAGDLLKTGDKAKDFDRAVATTFLQLGIKDANQRDRQLFLSDVIDDQVHTTGMAFLGLTLGCARCHDHKFDPIPTADYYSLAGFFRSTVTSPPVPGRPENPFMSHPVPDADGIATNVMGVYDDVPSAQRIFRRGSYANLGPVAPRRFLQITDGPDHLPDSSPGSGRLALARWVSSPTNPLTARVVVNRVWQHHFGAGIVATSDNFGILGDRPSHPELLDYLAKRFVGDGWSLKKLHRLMMLSNTYRQAGTEDAVARVADPDDRLLWRMPRRRLDGESVRDSLLAVSGDLDRTAGGPSVGFRGVWGDEHPTLNLYAINIRADYTPFDLPRRSIYLPMLRTAKPELLALYDQPDDKATITRRPETTVAPQALYLLNNPFVRRRAGNLAWALLSESKWADTDRVKRAYQLIYGRAPTDAEVKTGLSFLADYAGELDPTGAKQKSAGALEHRLFVRYDRLVRDTPGVAAYYRFEEGDRVEPSPFPAVNAVRPGSGDGQYLNNVKLSQPGALNAATPTGEGNLSAAFNVTNNAPVASLLYLVRLDDLKLCQPAGGEISVEFWAKPAALTTAIIVGRDDGAERLFRIGIRIIEDKAGKRTVFYSDIAGDGNGGMRTADESEFLPSTDKWSHVVLTYGGGTRRLFVNGKLADEAAVTGKLPTGTVPLTVGGGAKFNEGFSGWIDEVAVYRRALTAEDVTAHHGVGTGQAVKGVELSPRTQAWRAYCQALLCGNEFIYVE